MTTKPAASFLLESGAKVLSESGGDILAEPTPAIPPTQVITASPTWVIKLSASISQVVGDQVTQGLDTNYYHSQGYGVIVSTSPVDAHVSLAMNPSDPSRAKWSLVSS